jgi:quercetin dioxygenase-like cupin family protein
MPLPRRTFLATAGTVLAASAVRRGHAGAFATTLEEATMDITRVGSQPSARGPADWFTGTVRIDPLFGAKAPARAAGASVTFELGARTAWHTHPLGQTLIISAGCGWVQQEGGSVEEVHPGDVVWFPPGVRHWHGATPATAMTHIAVQEGLDGKVVDWLEHVSDEQYRK